MRIAACADVHFGTDSAGSLRSHCTHLAERADVLLIGGDLTRHGTPDEAAVLADELDGIGVPVVAVLGNHDYHADSEEEITKVLTAAGVVVLEGDSTVIRIGDQTLGIAGTKGFGGGFVGASGSDFGEREQKAYIGHTKLLAGRLERALADLDTDRKVALLHFSPVPDTLRGERLEIYPWLGSYLLAEAVDGGRADLVIHGHAHAGSEKGMTAGGVPVRNVAQPVIQAAYRLYCFGQSDDVCEPVGAAVPA